MVGADDAFDGMETILEPPSRIVKFVEQLLVLSGQCLGLLPLGDVVEDQPGQTEEERADDDRDDDDFFHRSGSLFLALRGLQRGELVRSEEHTSELQSLMRISYAVFYLK